MQQVEKVSPLALLLMRADSFAASQLVGKARPLAVVPFRLDNQSVGHLASILIPHEEGYDRQAFCQAFANQTAYIVGIPVASESARRLMARQFTELSDMSSGFLGAGLGQFMGHPTSDLVVSIDVDTQALATVLAVIRKCVGQEGVPKYQLLWLLDIIRAQVQTYEARKSLEKVTAAA